MTTVEIFHNVAQDSRGCPLGFFGYQPGQPLVKVFEFEVSRAADPIELAKLAFAVGNGETRDVSPKYYGRGLRSVSVGDLIRVGEVWVSYDPLGFSITREKVNDITATFETAYGTKPWER